MTAVAATVRSMADRLDTVDPESEAAHGIYSEAAQLCVVDDLMAELRRRAAADFHDADALQRKRRDSIMRAVK